MACNRFCVIRGCSNPVTSVGEPCGDCVRSRTHRRRASSVAPAATGGRNDHDEHQVSRCHEPAWGVVMSRANAVTPAPIIISRGRSAAERRLAAIAALHQPITENGQLNPLGLAAVSALTVAMRHRAALGRLAWRGRFELFGHWRSPMGTTTR
jgi:hypothetical protein